VASATARAHNLRQWFPTGGPKCESLYVHVCKNRGLRKVTNAITQKTLPIVIIAAGAIDLI